MSKKLIDFLSKYDFLDKLLLTLTLLAPFALLISILIADIIASLISLIILYRVFTSDDKLSLINEIKKPIILLLLFYLFVLLSLIDSLNIKISFLPSFFYFRYILFSLGIFYLIKNHETSLRLILYSLMILTFVISIDILFEYFRNNNIFSFKVEEFKISGSTNFYFTSFFDEEKKLGSFLIRLLPFILSLMIYLDINLIKKNKIDILIFLLFGFFIFLTSERTALFLYIIFSLLYFRFIKNKFKVLLSLVLMTIFLISTQYKLVNKYIIATLFQLNIINSAGATFKMLAEKDVDARMDFSNIKFYSTEHQEFIRAGINNFKEEPFTGTGIKTFFESCRKNNLDNNIYGNQSGEWSEHICSTHPHSTYVQLLSDTGIFSFIIITFFFLYILFTNLKIFFRRNSSRILKSYYVLNLGLILNLLPFVPSGSIFNNWINLMIYFPVGFWFFLYIKQKNEHY